MNIHHRQILKSIKAVAGKPVNDEFLESYLGSADPRYQITAPELRMIARDFMKHSGLTADALTEVVSSLVAGKTSTEKILAGVLLDYATVSQYNFEPRLFDQWLNHLIGWAQVDALCTGKYQKTYLVKIWGKWDPLLLKLSKDKSIFKRRASLVLLTSAVSHHRIEELCDAAFDNILRLRGEKDIVITKAISWLLRSMVRHYKPEVGDFVDEHAATLPAIAVRETRIKLLTGKKSG